MLEDQAVAASKRAGKITVFSVLWFCIFVLSGLGLSNFFHPDNPLVGLALFAVGFVLPLALLQLVVRLVGKRR